MVSATSYSLKRAFNAVSRLERYALISAGGDSEKSERSDEISVGTVKHRARERNLAPPLHAGRKYGENLPAWAKNACAGRKTGFFLPVESLRPPPSDATQAVGGLDRKSRLLQMEKTAVFRKSGTFRPQNL